MKSLIITILTLYTISFTASGSEDNMDLTLVNGDMVHAKLVSFQGSSVTVLPENGKPQQVVHISEFSPDSVNIIYEWALEKVLKNRRLFPISVSSESEKVDSGMHNFMMAYTQDIILKNASPMHIPALKVHYLASYRVGDKTETTIGSTETPMLLINTEYRFKTNRKTIYIREGKTQYFTYLAAKFIYNDKVIGTFVSPEGGISEEAQKRIDLFYKHSNSSRHQKSPKQPFDPDSPLYLLIRDKDLNEVPAKITNVNPKARTFDFNHTVTGGRYSTALDKLLDVDQATIMDWGIKRAIYRDTKIQTRVNHSAQPEPSELETIKRQREHRAKTIGGRVEQNDVQAISKDDNYHHLYSGYLLNIRNTSEIPWADLKVKYTIYKRKITWSPGVELQKPRDRTYLTGEYSIEELVPFGESEHLTHGIKVGNADRIDVYYDKENERLVERAVDVNNDREPLVGVRCRLYYKGEFVLEWADDENLIKTYRWTELNP